MKTFLGNRDIIEKEIKEIINKINHCSDVDEAIILVGSYELLVELYEEYTNKEYCNDKININNSLFDRAVNRYNNLYSSRVINYIETKNYHLDFSSSIALPLFDSLLEYDDIKYKKISLEEVTKIVRDYYLSVEDNKGLEIFNSQIKNRRIYNFGSKSGNTFGSTICNFSALSSYILLFYKNHFDITTTATLVHEVEHIKDFMNLTKRKQKLDGFAYEFRSIYPEVLSLKKEKNFLEYLIENNLYKEEAKNLYHKYYIDTFLYLNQLMVLSCFDKEYLEDDKYKKLKKDDIITIFKKKGLDILESCLVTNFDIDEELVYGYGGVLAVYFSYLEKNDKRRYKKSFKEFMNLRDLEFNTTNLEKIGTNVEELASILRVEARKYGDCKVYKK